MESVIDEVLPENLLRSLECPICKERYKVPKVLKCHHVFCKDCLDTYIENKEDESNFPPCPMCRQRFGVHPIQRAAAFPTHDFYQELIHFLSIKEAITRPKQKCQVCSNTEDCLQMKCLTCNLELCKTCATAHSTFKSTSEHTVMSMEQVLKSPIPDIISKRSILCRVHNDDVLKLYCCECKKVICLVCSMTDHFGHAIEGIHDTAEGYRNILECIEADLNASINSNTSKINSIKNTWKSFQDKAAKVDMEIMNHFNEKIKIIEKKRDEMLLEYKRQREVTEKRFSSQYELLDIENVRAITLSEHIRAICTYGCDPEIITQKRVLEETWLGLKCKDTYAMDNLEVNCKYIPPDNTGYHLESPLGEIKTVQKLPVTPVIYTGEVSKSASVLRMTSEDEKIAITVSTPTFSGYCLNLYTIEEKNRYTLKTLNQTETAPFHAVTLSGDNGTPISVLNVNHLDGKTQAEILSIKGDLINSFCLEFLPSCIASLPNGRFLVYNAWKGLVLYNMKGEMEQEVSTIRGKPVAKLMATNKKGLVALVGKLPNQTLFCRIISLNHDDRYGKVITEKIVTEDDGPWCSPFEPKAICLDGKGNILLCVTCKRRSKGIFSRDICEHSIVMIPNNSTLLGPEVFDIDISQAVWQNMALRDDGVLMLAIKNGTSLDIVQVRYLQ